ncbi:hypothetical protein PCASD_24253 [Puccinia coronata f. sp. avenae]|uniref:Uncharacterized protein n=1 Tax=Puccinia coronata f. sp. avenae TaxID=200324 RepID=A0A2N5TXC3_9BASI|nr:hypothetical protein PCASD_24253 [Puccinia coronata f. sp. avenae]
MGSVSGTWRRASSPSPIQVELSWPPPIYPSAPSDPVTPPISLPTPTPTPPPPDVPTPDQPAPEPSSPADLWSHLPLLEVPLQPRDDQRLTALMHSPQNSAHPSPQALSPSSLPISPLHKSSPPPSDITLITLPPGPPLKPASSPPKPSGPVSVPSAPPADRVPSPPPRRKSGRERKPPDCYGKWSKHSKAIEDVDTLKTWKQLLRSPN